MGFYPRPNMQDSIHGNACNTGNHERDYMYSGDRYNNDTFFENFDRRASAVAWRLQRCLRLHDAAGTQCLLSTLCCSPRRRCINKRTSIVLFKP